MKRICAISFVLCLGLVGTSSAQLPNIGGGAATQLQNRATVRVPSVDVRRAAQIRAGANFDSSRLRLNADARSRTDVRTRGLGVRTDGRTSSSAELRRRTGASQTPDRGTQDPSNEPRPRQEGNDVLLRTSLEFRNRMAEVEYMRDVAIQRGNVELMQRADQLEHALRVRFGQTSEQARGFQGEARQESQATVRTSQQFGNDVEARSRAGFNAAVEAQQQFESDARGRVQQGANTANRGFNNFRGEVQQRGSATTEELRRAEFEARARGEFRGSAEARTSGPFRQQFDATGEGQGRFDSRFGPRQPQQPTRTPPTEQPRPEDGRQPQQPASSQPQPASQPQQPAQPSGQTAN